MNYEKLGGELKSLAGVGLHRVIEGIVMSAPKSRRVQLLRAAGFFKGADLANAHGFSRQYAHKVLNENKYNEYRRFEIDGSVWWIKKPETYLH